MDRVFGKSQDHVLISQQLPALCRLDNTSTELMSATCVKKSGQIQPTFKTA